MKKISAKQRERDLLRELKFRKEFIKRNRDDNQYQISRENIEASKTDLSDNKWLRKYSKLGLNYKFIRKKTVTFILPEKMNFSNEYEITSIYINAIRRFSKNKTRETINLAGVILDNVKEISTPAALALTAELSRWDDEVDNTLTPASQNWDPIIFNQLEQLGFCDVFYGRSSSFTNQNQDNNCFNNNTEILRYIKGVCNSEEKTEKFKESLIKIVGKKINKWHFLYAGLSEAITNVTQHAYPNSKNLPDKYKSWFVTASYNTQTSELKIAFFDQGKTIPKTLPTSGNWENVKRWISRKFEIASGWDDKTLLQAAVETKRTSTLESDRGKGLGDLLEFIKETKRGYIAIISSKALYKLTINESKQITKTARFKTPLPGTLIIWSVTLN